jgi:hypothetical protein
MASRSASIVLIMFRTSSRRFGAVHILDYKPDARTNKPGWKVIDKLLVALWRYLETGVVPTGTVLKG